MALQAPHSLLMGPTGAGKTTGLATYMKAGVELFAIITEPTGVDSLLDAVKLYGVDINLLHWATVPPTSADWGAFSEMVSKINTLSYKDLSELKSGIGKEKMKQFPKLLGNMQNFKCERTGKEFGDVTTWDASRALAVDSLSGLSLITLQTTVGFKPSPHQGEWGIAMSATEQLLLKLSSDCQCYFNLTAHIEKEPDEISGTNKVGVSTLGKKLAPKIPRFFSEVIRARKEQGKNGAAFKWSTLDSECDLKNRALPASNDLAPSFEPIVQAFRARVEAAKGQAATPSA
jgi:hypothetical protein